MTAPIIDTPRLLLRPLEIADAPMLFQYKSDKETNKYQGFIPKSEKDMNEFIQKVSKEINTNGTWFQFVLIHKVSKEIIGDVGIHFLTNLKDQVELGITIAKKDQKNGFAIEAMQYVFDYLFNKLNKHRVIASIDPRNKGSLSLLNKLKMRREAYFVKSLYLHNEWVDDAIYALLKSEFNKIIKPKKSDEKSARNEEVISKKVKGARC